MLIFVGFFSLYFLFVIYFEAETFKMGKNLPYILKVINMLVPWLPARTTEHMNENAACCTEPLWLNLY